MALFMRRVQPCHVRTRMRQLHGQNLRKRHGLRARFRNASHLSKQVLLLWVQ